MDDLNSAARSQAKKTASGVEFRAEQIIAAGDASACYAKDFIVSLAMIPDDEAFDIRLKLKSKFGRDFNTKEFDARLKRERANLTPIPEVQDWESGLIRNDQGSPRACLANGLTALRKHPLWNGVLAFDEFALHTLKRKPAPWDNGNFKPGPWRDNDDREAANWLQHEGIMVNTGTASESAETVAYDAAFHPVREYLKGLKWDGDKRVDGWLNTYIGTPNTPYEVAVGTKWLISAIARVMQPGCKADHTLIFEGKQGKLKSTALQVMGDPWFIDHLPDLSSKDAASGLCGVWIVELGELASLRKTSSIESIKEFLTRQKDRFRPPYGRRTIEVARQCVFSASTNSETWHADETGGRRFWPVRCGKIEIEDLRRDRDQLWAEAMDMYLNQKRNWWIDNDSVILLAQREQEDRYEEDPWEELVLEWAFNPIPRSPKLDKDGRQIGPDVPFNSSKEDRISIPDVLNHAINKSVEKWVHWDHVRIGKIFRKNGWVRFQERTQDENGKASYRWLYKRPL